MVQRYFVSSEAGSLGNLKGIITLSQPVVVDYEDSVAAPAGYANRNYS